MGLLSTVQGLGNTAANIGTLGSNLLDSAAKWIGLQSTEKNVDDQYVNYGSNGMAKSNKVNDIRGRSSVYRAPVNTYSQDSSNGTSSFKSTYSMDYGDFCWKQSAFSGKDSQDFQPKVQKIIIKEFQPYQQSFLGQAIATTKGYGKEISQSKKMTASGKGLTYAFVGSMVNGGKKNALGNYFKNLAVQEYSQKPDLLYDSNLQDTYSNPFVAIQRLFTQGFFIHTFEVPLLNPNPYNFITATDQTFQRKGGGGLKEVIEFGQQIFKRSNSGNKNGNPGDMFKNIPASPTYEETLPYRKNDLVTTFYLINKNSQYLVRNYRFLQALAAGAYQVQLPAGMLQSPNVYYVQVVGKRELVWAQMGVSADQIGKYRTDKYAAYKIYNETKAQLFKGNADGNYENILWPQAWKVTLTFNDFTPNTFNAYQHYLRYGSCLAALEANTGDMYQAVNKKVQEKTGK